MTDKPKVMSGETLDIAEQRRAELKQLFPGVFTETTDANGKVVETVDFERLKAELGTFSNVYEGRRERYGMDWPGKRDCMKLIQEPTRATLKPCREESINFDNTDNLFVEGDNLEVLKLLQKSYYGKVKMIYIDPPYNTGKEFIYPDNFQESLDTYLAYAGLLDNEGKKFTTNTSSEGRYHTKWLNMMFPRIYLARNLLREDGVIFISIDDNEIDNLKKICNEVFGEENHVTTVSWLKKVSPSNDATWFSGDHEYLLVYARSKEVWRPNRLPLTAKQKANYTNPDNDPRGGWNSVAYTCNKTSDERPNLYFPITNPHTGEEVWPKKSAVWKFSKDVVKKHLEENLIYWGKDGTSTSPRYKKFLTDSQGVVPRSVWRYEDVGHTQMATEVFQSLVPEIKFDTPKPPKLIRQMLLISTSPSSNDIVMDFFAGSGTLGQAVIETNSEDKGNRRFILVQLPEKTDSSIFSSIADIAKERVKRVISKTKDGAESMDGAGFRVVKLDQSNFKQWRTVDSTTPDEIERQLDLHVNNVDESATQEEILFELLIKAGFELSENVKEIVVSGKVLYAVADGALIICLEDELSSDLIDAVADMEPMQFICLDKAFNGNDQLKANAVQTFKAKSQNSESELVFKVV